mmetsp:Transcript_7009/g.21455  ORF Transcript_7009/g.21455 Transcript_7009/m.21455 type:complete len:206 (-) Transcript_7009:630-1247(-)
MSASSSAICAADGPASGPGMCRGAAPAIAAVTSYALKTNPATPSPVSASMQRTRTRHARSSCKQRRCVGASLVVYAASAPVAKNSSPVFAATRTRTPGGSDSTARPHTSDMARAGGGTNGFAAADATGVPPAAAASTPAAAAALAAAADAAREVLTVKSSICSTMRRACASGASHQSCCTGRGGRGGSASSVSPMTSAPATGSPL